jgi:hypothetical protein
VGTQSSGALKAAGGRALCEPWLGTEPQIEKLLGGLLGPCAQSLDRPLHEGELPLTRGVVQRCAPEHVALPAAVRDGRTQLGRRKLVRTCSNSAAYISEKTI